MENGAEGLNQVVQVPYWAWVLAGGVLSVLGGKLLGFFLDLFMLFIKGKTGVADGEGRSQIDQCHSSCQPSWEKSISEAILQAEIRFGAKLDAKLDNALNRIHERLDKLADT